MVATTFEKLFIISSSTDSSLAFYEEDRIPTPLIFVYCITPTGVSSVLYIGIIITGNVVSRSTIELKYGSAYIFDITKGRFIDRLCPAIPV